MAYTAPKTYSAGAVLTASELNTYQRDNITFLAGLANTSTGALQADAVVAPHSIGTTVLDYIGCRFAGSFTSGGASTQSTGVRIAYALTGATGDTGAAGLSQVQIGGNGIAGSITTQGATETVALVSSLFLSEPNITVGSGDTVTKAATLYILDAPTEGTNNYALYVEAGDTRLDGDVIMQATQRLYLDGGTHTYIYESAADFCRWTVGGSDILGISDQSADSFLEVNVGNVGSEPSVKIAGSGASYGITVGNFDNDTGQGPGISVGSNRDTTNPAAGWINLETIAPAPRYIWIDNSGSNDVRTHSAPPSNSGGVGDTAGTVIGTQTSWHELKTEISESPIFPDLAADRLRDVPLFTFRFKADGQRDGKRMHGLVIHEKDRGSCWWGMNMKDGQIPCLDEAEIFGTLIGGWKNHDVRVENHEARIRSLEARVQQLEALCQP